MRGRNLGKPAGNVLLADGKGLAGKQNERIENGAPSNVVFRAGIVKMSAAENVLGEQQSPAARVPDGEGPIAEELGKTLFAPLFVSCGGNGNVSGFRGR